MTKTCRLSIAGLLMIGLSVSPWNAALIASGPPESRDAPRPSAAAVQVSDVGSFTDRSIGAPVRDGNTRALFAAPVDLEAFSDGSWFAFRDENGRGWPSAPGSMELNRAVASGPPMFHADAAGQIFRGRPYPVRRGHGGAVAALVVGAVASITGAAILVYANRPECRYREFATGCGYGTKVVGGAVLAGGVVGLTIGALTWR